MRITMVSNFYKLREKDLGKGVLYKKMSNDSKAGLNDRICRDVTHYFFQVTFMQDLNLMFFYSGSFSLEHENISPSGSLVKSPLTSEFRG